MATSGSAQYEIDYALNPIIMTGGVAGGIPGGALSIISVVQSLSFNALPSPGDYSSQNAFAHFIPIVGSTIIDNQIGTYPFANRAIAANAIINQPLRVSLLMRVPAIEANGGFGGKLAIMTSLQSTLAQHTINEGTFTVATPSFYFTDCILKSLTDVSSGESLQTQYEWRWDFEQPLISLQGAAVVQNNLMSLLSSGGPTNGDTNVTGDPTSAAGSIQVPGTNSNAAGLATTWTGNVFNAGGFDLGGFGS